MTTTLILDFETYYSRTYTLKKLSPLEYVRHQEFDVFGCAIKKDKNKVIWLSPPQIDKLFATIDWETTTVVAHNCLFDGLILNEIYNIKPAQWVDTIGLTRALLPTLKSYSLESLGKTLGLGIIKTDISNLQGKRLLSALEQKTTEMRGIGDVRLCNAIFKLLYKHLPETERRLLHLTTRLSVEPDLIINKKHLNMAINIARVAKEQLIQNSGYKESLLNSNIKFNTMLKNDHNIFTPTKTSPITGIQIPSLGKADAGFLKLQADYPKLRHIWQGRLAARSNIEITRGERMQRIAATGNLSLPLKYYGAHTGRWSGTGFINPQNLPRKSALRTCIEAPPFHSIVVVDSAQIELRINAWFCGLQRTLDLLKEGKDIYIVAAAEHFFTTYEDIGRDDPRRAFGKMLELALGYNMGWKKFQENAAIGFMGTEPLIIPDGEAQQTVQRWRNSHNAIQQMWNALNTFIGTMTLDSIEDNPIAIKCVEINYERVELPNGMSLNYPSLRFPEGGNGWIYGYGDTETYIYGGKLLENIIQALARIVIADQMLEIDDLPEAKVVGMTHDEVILIVKTKHAENCYAECVKILKTPPSWAPDLPLDATGGVAKNYSK